MKNRWLQYWKAERWVLLHLMLPILLWTFVAGPWWSRLESEYQSASVKHQILRERHQALPHLEAEIRQQQTLLKELHVLESRARANLADTLPALDSLRRLGEEQGLRLREIQATAAASSGPPPLRRGLRMHLEGNYSAWHQFLARIAERHPALRLERADLQMRGSTLIITAEWAQYGGMR